MSDTNEETQDSDPTADDPSADTPGNDDIETASAAPATATASNGSGISPELLMDTYGE